jgi:hypothetical protein
MENSNNLSSSILQSSPPSSSIGTEYIGSTSLSGDSNSGFFQSISGTTWVIIVLILAFMGFNIFVYLAKGSQSIADFLGSLIQKIFGITLSLTGQTVNVSAEGAKAVVSGTATTVDTGLSAVQDVASPSTIKSQPVQTNPDTSSNDTLHTALNKSQEQNMDYQAQQASSSVHSAGKSGWCFIGDDRGNRSCAMVNEDDKCMSGDIFPSQELCINPNLRA